MRGTVCLYGSKKRSRPNNRGNLFSSVKGKRLKSAVVGEAGEVVVFLTRETAFGCFLSDDGFDEEGHVAAEVTHCLESFEVFLDVFGLETVNLVPIGR